MTKIINKLTIQGIKGVLDRSGDFSLAKKNKPYSIVIFAPNACGKSGYADAIEYLFSDDGGVEHLGKGGSDSERGGKHALPHVLAEEKGIESKITIEIQDTETGDRKEITRQVVTGRSDIPPKEIDELVKIAPAHRVLRQHDLRRFVVDMSPSEKYSELSRWIGVTRFEEILKQLRTTSNSLAEVNKDKEIKERLEDICTVTSNQIVEHNPEQIFSWCSENAKPFLAHVPNVSSWEDIESVIGELEREKDGLLIVSTESTKYKAKNALQTTLINLLDPKGSLTAVSSALSEAVVTDGALKKAKEEAKDSVFSEVWKKAKTLLTKAEYETCPVCFTEWNDTVAGSQQSAIVHLETSLKGLEKYNQAEESLKRAKENYNEKLNQLIIEWSKIEEFASELEIAVLDEGEKGNYRNELMKLQNSTNTFIAMNTDYKKIESNIRNKATSLKKTIEGIKIKGVPVEVKAIDSLISNFGSLRVADTRLEELKSQEAEYRQVETKFNDIEKEIRSQIAELINSIIKEFKGDVISIYKKIHPSGDIPNIHITPDTINRTLILRIDFHKTGRTVPPAGYLSESYINSLGLALFISSVRMFNQSFPFIFLDDIVSSYDADHRGRIVDVIAESLDEFQVFLTTHDYMFYKMLRDRLVDQCWIFEVISNWDLQHGPEKEQDCFSESEVDRLIQAGQTKPAGNAVRQYMEDWLDKTCEKYQVHTVHRRNFKEYQRTLFDFWSPFINKIMSLSGGFFNNKIENEPCFDRLKSSPLLNYYSHAQANPYAWPALGDVEYIWTEFKEFMKFFYCKSCNKLLKYSVEDNRLYCTCGGYIFSAEEDKE